MQGISTFFLAGVSLPAEGEGLSHQPQQRPRPPCHPRRYDTGDPQLCLELWPAYVILGKREVWIDNK